MQDAVVIMQADRINLQLSSSASKKQPFTEAVRIA